MYLWRKFTASEIFVHNLPEMRCLKIKRPKVFASNVDCVLPLFVDMSIARANIGSDRFSFRYKVNSVGRPSSSDQQQTIPGESNDKNV